MRRIHRALFACCGEDLGVFILIVILRRADGTATARQAMEMIMAFAFAEPKNANKIEAQSVQA